MALCPAGHESTSTDYCDTCGIPVESAQQQPSTPTPAAAESTPCPNCAAVNVPDALFCEACGYDFTTGAMPRGAEESEDDSGNTPAPGEETPEDDQAEQTAPADEGQPADQPPAEGQPPAELLDIATPPPAADPAPEVAPQEPVDQLEVPVAPAEPSAGEVLATDAPTTPDAPAETPGAAQPAPVEWVAELWIDPDWYRLQGSDEQLPSPGLPDIVPLRSTSLLIGRVSASRNIHPDIDCEIDTGVSRRHAQLSTDGSRWWIEDLQSSNGTFVGNASGPLPGMPIGRGRVELAPDQRIYLGAWTRIVIRRATEDELQAYSAG